MFFYNASNQPRTSNPKRGSNYFLIALEKLGDGLLKILKEIFFGIYHNTISWGYCSSFVILANIVMLASLDVWLFNYYGYSQIYLEYHFLSWIAYFLLATFGFVTWGAYISNIKRKMLKKLKEAFTNAALKSKSGRFPNFVSDVSIDENNRKLTLTNQGLTLEQFKDARGPLETTLRCYIDGFKEDREFGTVEILYSHSPLPELVKFQDMGERKNYRYTAGKTRSQEITGDFTKSPHLLVAGQTNGGKSNFLRQMFLSLYLGNKKAKFALFDLKDGLELNIFKDLKRVDFFENFEGVIQKLIRLDEIMAKRMLKIKEADCNNIVAYQKKMKREDENVPPLDRHFVFIDEAAELFLKTDKNDIPQVQKARSVLSRVARLGRACGVHLIIATQRPDVKSIDPQIKANLTSTLCFPVPNLATSMTVLSNGRAAQLPNTKGRAIWKNGGVMTEVQTPFLTEEKIREIIKPLPKKETHQEQMRQTQPTTNSSLEIDNASSKSVDSEDT